MSKPMTRVVFAVVISLAILAAIFTVAQAGAVQKILNSGRVSSHFVSGAMVNLDHQRLSRTDQALYQVQLDSNTVHINQGHDCNSDLKNSPDD